MNVLVLEDNPANLLLVAAVLGRAGHRLHAAHSVAEFEAALSASRPDVVLLDLQLPDGDGLRLVGRLKSEPATAAIAVIALTAYATAADRAQGLAAGCDAYITKPIDTRTFAAEVAAIAGRGFHGPCSAG